TLVQVEGSKSRTPDRAEQSDATDAEDDLLHQAIAGVAAIQMVGEMAIFGPIVGDVGVQQQHRDGVAGRSDDVVAPGANLYGPPLHVHSNLRFQPAQQPFRLPCRVVLNLPVVANLLAEVPASMDE